MGSSYYLAEGKRLGITPPPKLELARRDHGAGPGELCIEGCRFCRDFRNKVRAALAEERATTAAQQEELRHAVVAEVDAKAAEVREVVARFRPIVINDETAQAISELQDRFADLAADLVADLPSSRSRSLALTHLEEASRHATRAIAEAGST